LTGDDLLARQETGYYSQQAIESYLKGSITHAKAMVSKPLYMRFIIYQTILPFINR
jgi:hypothetical protein